MAELANLIEQQNAKIDVLTIMVRDLQRLVMKDKVDVIWVSEEVAAQMLNLSPAWLRRKVKEGKFPFNEINYRHTNSRNYQYSRKGIMRFKELTRLN